MGALVVSDNFDIQSHKGVYSIFFRSKWLENLDSSLLEGHHFLVDSKVAELYAKQLAPVLNKPGTILIDALEENKSIERVIPIIEQLIVNNTRRGDSLVAIGGGIVQDITCFIATIYLRGLNWKFIPTTLLAQADSCIGSKSSINLSSTKNILGTFNPPSEIFVCPEFLDTLNEQEIKSGIGEILKVHAIDSDDAFSQLALNYDELKINHPLLNQYIHQALLIKKKYIEIDEFDKGIRNIFNYGHSFGHAIESASKYLIPHGIAVSMGMDMANRISTLRGLTPIENFNRMHSVLRKNYETFSKAMISLDEIISALRKDKKNTATQLALIFPVGESAAIKRVDVLLDDDFRSQCQIFLDEMKNESH